MKVAVIGSRSLYVTNLQDYLPADMTEIVSGGAQGVDACAREYAYKNKIPIKEFLPDYKRYGRGAPLKRNLQIIDYADVVVAFWDGKSPGTANVITCCKKLNKKITVHIFPLVPTKKACTCLWNRQMQAFLMANFMMPKYFDRCRSQGCRPHTSLRRRRNHPP